MKKVVQACVTSPEEGGGVRRASTSSRQSATPSPRNSTTSTGSRSSLRGLLARLSGRRSSQPTPEPTPTEQQQEGEREERRLSESKRKSERLTLTPVPEQSLMSSTTLDQVHEEECDVDDVDVEQVESDNTSQPSQGKRLSLRSANGEMTAVPVEEVGNEDESAEETSETKEPEAKETMVEESEGEKGIKVSVESIPLIKSILQDTKRSAEWIEAMRVIRKLLSTPTNPPIEEVVSSGLLELIFNILRESQDKTLLFESWWSVTNVASGSSEHTWAVLKHNPLEVAEKHLDKSFGKDIVEQVIRFLGNVAGDGHITRDACLASSVYDAFLIAFAEQMEEYGLQFTRNSTWALSSFVLGKPAPRLEFSRRALPLLAKLVNHDDEEIQIEACWALSRIADGPSENIQAVLDIGVVPRLVELVNYERRAVCTPALRAAGNIVTGDDMQTERVVQAGILPKLKALLENSSRQGLLREALWMTSNITAGNQMQIQAVIDAGLIPVCVEMLFNGANDIQKEACWAVSNLTSGGSPQQLQVVDAQGMRALCKYALRNLNDPRTLRVAVEGLSNLSKVEECHPTFRELEDPDISTTLSAILDSETASQDSRLVSQVTRICSYLGLELDEISEEDLEAIRSRFDYGLLRAGTGEYAPFTTMESVAKFWLKMAEMEEGDAQEYVAEIEPAYKRSVLIFFDKLRGAKEFELEKTRVGLAKRVVEVLETMAKFSDTRDALVMRMVDSIDACNDKPIWALNQMQLLLEVSKARGDREKLRALAWRVLRLQVVHKHALKKLTAMNFDADDVCIFLRFEIELRETLDLPVSAVRMWFPGYYSLSKEEIEDCEKEATDLTEEDLENFLSTWEEWQRQDRFEMASKLTWKELPRSSVDFRKSLRNVFGNAVKDGVRFKSEKAEWSFHDLLEHWVKTGMDLNNTPRSLDDMKRLVRARSLLR